MTDILEPVLPSETMVPKRATAGPDSLGIGRKSEGFSPMGLGVKRGTSRPVNPPRLGFSPILRDLCPIPQTGGLAVPWHSTYLKHSIWNWNKQRVRCSVGIGLRWGMVFCRSASTAVLDRSGRFGARTRATTTPTCLRLRRRQQLPHQKPWEWGVP